MQASCSHTHIAESTHNGWEPHRICEDCGIEEWHGGDGFHVLRGATRKVSNVCSLRPAVGGRFVGWCYGKRGVPEHAVDADLMQGTRCCIAHDVAGDSKPAPDRAPLPTITRPARSNGG